MSISASTGSGSRSGAIAVVVSGETSLRNGGGTRAIWRIGHHSAAGQTISSADVSVSTGTLDYTTGAAATDATLNADFVTKFEQNIVGGNVSVTATGPLADLISDAAWSYASTNGLSLISERDLTINQALTNTLAGAVNLSIGQLTAGTLNMLAAVTSVAPVNITGGALDDTFNLPDGLDTFFPGVYTFSGGGGGGGGGGGVETLTLPDSSDADGEFYTLSNSQLLKNATDIQFSNFEEIALSTGDGADTVTITDLATIAMFLDGGGPTTAPGDTLIAFGYEHLPGLPGDGFIDPLITYINFEAVNVTLLERPPEPVVFVPSVLASVLSPRPSTPAALPSAPVGEEILETAERVELDMLGLERRVSGRDRQLAGAIRMTMVDVLATDLLMPDL